ncbi:MAG: Spy/CpxP family protein refolding chaperone [Candidatus Cloacimonetes bacterium]|nr:Spy/CpxP family protein refolding chaperone [Candidatus Cloacimonadota bacterium]
MKKITITIVMVFALMATLTAFEKPCEEMEKFEGKMNPGEEYMMREGFGGFDRIHEELDLTEKQIETMEEMRLAHQKEMIGMHAEIDIMKVDKHSAVKNHDFAKTKKITAKMFDLKKSLAIKKIEQHETMWNLLTPEQQEKAKELMKDRPRHKKILEKKVMQKKMIHQ